MNILVVGLGLIGGSVCKSLKANTHHKVFGFDIDENVLSDALNLGAIDDILSSYEEIDVVFVALHLSQSIDYILENINSFKKGTIICDLCGVKEIFYKKVEKALTSANVQYVGAHPMAGKEFSGFRFSSADLFNNANFIITKSKFTDDGAISIIESLALTIGFSNIILTTPSIHDEIIAYTSQLAHIVSSSYVKSNSFKRYKGFSAGSFDDLTRVARLNENMWTDLLMANNKNIISEINVLIDNLNLYKQALTSDDKQELKELLRNGREIKENLK